MRQLVRASLLAALLSPPLATVARPQGSASLDPIEVQQRLLEVLGRRPAAPVGGWTTARLGLAPEAAAGDPWAERGQRKQAAIRFVPLELRTANNTHRPWGTNDGPVWQGKGITTSLSGGFVASWRGVRATVNPVLWSAANTDFDLSPLATSPGLSPFSYPTRSTQRIDAPQRFGNAAVTRLDPGQSSITFTARNAVVGYSTATQRWGPARRNPIMLSQNAGGFGHVFVGTSEPADVRIGRVHAQWLWGRLTESGFFDTLANNGSRYITGATVSFFPKFAPGLELGASRVFVTRWRNGGPTYREAVLLFLPLPKTAFVDTLQNNPFGDDDRDQTASLFARWVTPASGFEVYGEWARGDHSADLRDFVVQPEHASAFALGFQKTFHAEPGAFWHLGGEATVLGAPRTSRVRAPRTAFYQHHLIRQGYTQRGQVLGAGIGSGSSQVSVELGRVAQWGRASVTLQRTVYDNDRFYAYAVDTSYNRAESEPAAIAEGLLFRGPFEFGASLAIAKLYNKHYLWRDDETNIQVGVLARYRWR